MLKISNPVLKKWKIKLKLEEGNKIGYQVVLLCIYYINNNNNNVIKNDMSVFYKL